MLYTPHHQISRVYEKICRIDFHFLPRSIRDRANSSKNSTRDEGAAGAVAVATPAKEKHGKNAPGGLETLKISNNFGLTGRRNPLRAARLDGGGSELGTPRKKPVEGTPRKMVQGREVKFPFRLDPERAYGAQSMQSNPPTITTKYKDPDNRTNQRPYGGHGKARAPKVPAKDGHGLKIASSEEDDSNNNEIVHVGATKPALL